MSTYRYARRQTHDVWVGHVPMGSSHPLVMQSMTNTSTRDIEASVDQIKRIVQAGGEIVRLTTQGHREVESLAQIRAQLHADGVDVPLVADVHFNPDVADFAAQCVEKVRINPGNFVDAPRTFRSLTYTDAEYTDEILKIRHRLVPLLAHCRTHHTALRIGVNHGSLSDRILSRYGDTPLGMVESCMEFLRICVSEHFFDVVLSVKASNPVVMVHTVRLLAQTMQTENMTFPIHLGVTEAGESEDGRIKSAVGIGALLSEGIGDTIRVSLTEPPECEIPVAQRIIRYINTLSDAPALSSDLPPAYSSVKSRSVLSFGGGHLPFVITSKKEDTPSAQSDFIFDSEISSFVSSSTEEVIPVQDLTDCADFSSPTAVIVNENSISDIASISCDAPVILVFETSHPNPILSARLFFSAYNKLNLTFPVILRRHYDFPSIDDLQIVSAIECGALFLDGFFDALWIDAPFQPSFVLTSLSLSILQATRRRITHTEYISCPGCGRTLFDLSAVVHNIKSRTEHLSHLKIGIMGCIVNGPGEMADADYGYVGAGVGKISLYKGKTCVERNIPSSEAVDHLIALIKSSGDWQ